VPVRLGVVIAGLLIGAAGMAWVIGACGDWPKGPASSGLKGDAVEHAISEQVIEAATVVRTDRIQTTISDLQTMTERASWERQTATARYLTERLRLIGIVPEVAEYQHEDHPFANLVVTFPGRVQTQKRLLAVAHYDSKNWTEGSPAPGADDDATGVSVLLELARLIAAIDHRRTWQLVFFSYEERGQMGSRCLAHQLHRDGVDIAGVISVDVVGYRPPGITEISQLIGSSADPGRKLKGLAKVFRNAYLARRHGCARLKFAFRARELAVAPPVPIREAFGRSVYWQLGGACP